jgi:hypothetical protein
MRPYPPSCDRASTEQPLSSVGLRAHSGPHSMYIGMSEWWVSKKRGGEGHPSRILRAAGARKLVKTLRAGFSGGADPEGRRRHIVSLPPSRPTSLPPKRTTPPGDLACRGSCLRVSAMPWCRFPTGSTPGTDIFLVTKKSLRTWLSGGG